MLRNSPLRSPGNDDLSGGNDGADTSGGDESGVVDLQTEGEPSNEDLGAEAGAGESGGEGTGQPDDEGGEGAGAANEESEDDKGLRALVFSQMTGNLQNQNQHGQQQQGGGGAGESKPGKLTTALKAGVDKFKAKCAKEGYEFTDDIAGAFDELLAPIAARLDEQDHRETSTQEAQKAKYDNDWNSCLDSVVEANPEAVKMLGSFASGSANQQARKVVHDMALSFQRANPKLAGPKAFEKVIAFLYGAGSGGGGGGKNMNQSSKSGNSAAGGQHAGNTRRQPPQGRPATGNKDLKAGEKKPQQQQDDGDGIDPRLRGGVLQSLRSVTSKIVNGS